MSPARPVSLGSRDRSTTNTPTRTRSLPTAPARRSLDPTTSLPSIAQHRRPRLRPPRRRASSPSSSTSSRRTRRSVAASSGALARKHGGNTRADGSSAPPPVHPCPLSLSPASSRSIRSPPTRRLPRSLPTRPRLRRRLPPTRSRPRRRQRVRPRSPNPASSCNLADPRSLFPVRSRRREGCREEGCRGQEG